MALHTPQKSIGQVSSYDRLAAEIDRIIRSPYPTQLKTLHDIVCHQCQIEDIARWAGYWPCKVDRLLEEVLHAAAQWNYAIELLARLCESTKCRLACLLLDPLLLPNAVRRSLQGDESHQSLAITLLSYRLPTGSELPTEAQDLLLYLVDCATRQASEDNIKNVYLVLRGSLQSVIDFMPARTLDIFEAQLLQILGSTQSKEGDRYALYALGAMRTLLSSNLQEYDQHVCSGEATGALSPDLHELPATSAKSTHWTSTKLPAFFAGTKAAKTLHLLTLRVLFACRSQETGLETHACKTISLALELLEAVPRHLRHSWSTDNKAILHKLSQKLQNTSLDLTLRLYGLAFLAALSYRSPGHHQDYAKTLLQIVTTHRTHLRLSSSTATMLRTLYESLDDHAIGQMAALVPQYLGSEAHQRVIDEAVVIGELLMDIAKRAAGSDSVASTMLDALATQSCTKSLGMLNERVTAGLACEVSGASVCVRAYLNNLQAQALDFSSLVLRLGFNHDNITTLLREHFVIMLDIIEKCGQPRGRCNCTSLSAPSTIVGTPGTSSTTHWRDGVLSILQNRETDSHSALVAHFEAACHDLELRCATVEVPLVQARENCAALEERNASLTAAATVCQQTVSDVQSELEQATAQNASLTAAVQRGQEEMLVLQGTVSSLEWEKQNLIEQNQCEIQHVCSTAEMKELDAAITIAKQQEQIEELKGQLTRQSHSHTEETSRLGQELEEQSGCMARLQEDMENLRQSIALRNTEHNTLRSRGQELDGQIVVVQVECSSLRQSLAEQEVVHTRAMESAVQEHTQLRDEQVRTIITEQEALMAETKAASLAHQEEMRKSMLSRPQHADGTVKQQKERLVSLANQVARLRQDRAEMEYKLAESQAIRLRMMAAMGVRMDAAYQIPPATRLPSSEGELSEFDVELAISATSINVKPSSSRRPNSVAARSALTPESRRQTFHVPQKQGLSTRKPLKSVAHNATPQEIARQTQTSPAKEAYTDADTFSFEGSDIFVGSYE